MLQIAGRDLNDAVSGLSEMESAGYMRCDQRVRLLPQWMFRRQRFGFRDIETGTGKMSLRENITKRGGINRGSPADIEQYRARFHPEQTFAVE